MGGRGRGGRRGSRQRLGSDRTRDYWEHPASPQAPRPSTSLLFFSLSSSVYVKLVMPLQRHLCIRFWRSHLRRSFIYTWVENDGHKSGWLLRHNLTYYLYGVVPFPAPLVSSYSRSPSSLLKAILRESPIWRLFLLFCLVPTLCISMKRINVSTKHGCFASFRAIRCRLHLLIFMKQVNMDVQDRIDFLNIDAHRNTIITYINRL